MINEFYISIDCETDGPLPGVIDNGSGHKMHVPYERIKSIVQYSIHRKIVNEQ